MVQVSDSSAREQNLADLQVSSLSLMALFAAAVGFAWFILVAWPETGGEAPPVAAWAGGIFLMLTAVPSFLLREQARLLASALLMAGMWLASACAVLTLPSAQGACLFILPIIFASILLNQKIALALAGLAGLFTLAGGLYGLDLSALSLDLWLPVVIILTHGPVARVLWKPSASRLRARSDDRTPQRLPSSVFG